MLVNNTNRTTTSQGREYSVYFNIVFHPFFAHFKNVVPHAHNWSITTDLPGLNNGPSNPTLITATASVIEGDHISPFSASYISPASLTVVAGTLKSFPLVFVHGSVVHAFV